MQRINVSNLKEHAVPLQMTSNSLRETDIGTKDRTRICVYRGF